MFILMEAKGKKRNKHKNPKAVLCDNMIQISWLHKFIPFIGVILSILGTFGLAEKEISFSLCRHIDGHAVIMLTNYKSECWTKVKSIFRETRKKKANQLLGSGCWATLKIMTSFWQQMNESGKMFFSLQKKRKFENLTYLCFKDHKNGQY